MEDNYFKCLLRMTVVMCMNREIKLNPSSPSGFLQRPRCMLPTSVVGECGNHVGSLTEKKQF